MNDDLLLAIETSSRRGSVALGRGELVLGSRTLAADRKHTAELLPAIRDLLTEAGTEPGDVGTVCFSQGPGSFTGLRVVATLARIWQSAVGCRVVAAPSLEVIARNALEHRDHPTRLAVILDAKRGQVSGAVFEREGDAELRTVADAGRHQAGPWLGALEQPCWVLGEGVAEHEQAVSAAGLAKLSEWYWLPEARQALAVGRRLVRAGRFCTPAEIVPLYLRPPECEEVYEQRRAEARRRRANGE